MQRLAEEVGRIRGLPPRSPLDVRMLDTAELQALLRKKTESARTEELKRESLATWIAFGFVEPSVDVYKAIDAVIDEQIAGLYDPETKELLIRRDSPETKTSTGGAAVDATDLLLAHEIQHALQDQHFGLPTEEQLLELKNEDVRFAHKSLFEGEATAVMLAVAAERSRQPIAPMLIKGAQVFRTLPSGTLAKMTGHSSALAEAPPIIRDALLFPYSAGMAFVVDVYRAGGFELVDRLFQHRPESTEHILHPEKYFAGERPIDVPDPSGPEGLEVLSHGTLGEFGVRILFNPCLGMGQANNAGSGWGGDAYSVAAGVDGSLALVWSTVWDDEESAARFAQALRDYSTCWPAEKAPGHESSLRVSNAYRVFTLRDRVVFIRGVEPGTVDPMADAALAQAVTRLPPAPPLGEVTIPPEAGSRMGAEVATPGRGRVEGGHFIHDGFGVRVPIPSGFEPLTDQPSVMVAVKRAAGPLAVGFFNVESYPYSEEVASRVLDTLISGFTARFPRNVPLDRSPVRPLTSPLGKGVEQTVRIGQDPIFIRAIIIAACGGRAMYTIATTSVTEEGKRELDSWVSSIESTGIESPPSCPAS